MCRGWHRDARTRLRISTSGGHLLLVAFDGEWAGEFEETAVAPWLRQCPNLRHLSMSSIRDNVDGFELMRMVAEVPNRLETLNLDGVDCHPEPDEEYNAPETLPRILQGLPANPRLIAPGTPRNRSYPDGEPLLRRLIDESDRSDLELVPRPHGRSRVPPDPTGANLSLLTAGPDSSDDEAGSCVPHLWKWQDATREFVRAAPATSIAPPTLTAAEVERFKEADLKRELKVRGLRTNGLEAALKERLLTALG
mmetsp:Transcript_690/g.2014  ORF Transcript_690/g.2014 Transcript_690/m.2014 type:complete len:252 (-) Transcript_690:30-785(-)